MTDHAFFTLREIARQLHSRAISPVEITESMLARIATVDPSLRSYVHVCEDTARAAARQAEAEIGRGEIRGPLHGVPIAVKDLCAMEGTPTRVGSPHVDWNPGLEATVVVRLREAGAVILGKLQLTEGAFGSHHPDIAPPVSPWGAEMWTGVSSSGSGVATAAGLCFASLGSDTGGSIRFPSHCCGVTGLKPTYGRVSRAGVFPLAESLDHIGPMTRSVEDAAAVLGVIAGPDAADPTAAPEAVPDYLASLDGSLRGLRVGLDESYCDSGVFAPEIPPMLRDAAERLRARGATIVPVEVPSGRAVAVGWTLLCGIETALAHEDRYPSRASEYGPALAALIDLGRGASGLDIARAQRDRAEFAGALTHVFETVDVFISPTSYALTPTVEFVNEMLAGGDVSDILSFTAPTDGSGHPALCLPGGFTADGIPYGFQLIGRRFGERDLLRAGYAYQQDTDWHRRHPAE